MDNPQNSPKKQGGFAAWLDSFFNISERGSTIRTEIIAGLTTFFAMAYIVVTNPNQVTGFVGLPSIWNSVYIASILVAVIGTLLMAFYAKMPFAQACGMGLNSFFFTSFILPNLAGDTMQGYKEGLAVILLSGVIFMILSWTGLRQYIAKALPENLKKAIPAGIGLFIAFIGFKNVGIIEANPYTYVQLFDFHGAVSGKSFFDAWCAIAPVVLALLGLFAMGILSKKNVKGSVIITILGVTVLYYLTTWTAPSFDLGQIGQSFKDFGNHGLFGAFEGFKTVFSGGFGAIVSVIVLIITFCLVDMFDTIGTLYGTASQANMIDENGDPHQIKECMNSDSIATVSGALLGTSTCTTFVESAAGVGAGGRTGLTSVVTSICFFLCLFLAPFAAIIPACATAPALIFVGVLMLKGFAKVDLDDIASAIPAFLALIMMPLTYSISNGIAVGAISYVIITAVLGKYTKKDISVTVIALLFVLRFFLVTM